MKRKPSLLVLASTHPRWQGDSEPGFVHELSRRLTDSFEVTVVCPAAPGAPLREIMDGVQVRRFRYAPDRLQTLVNDGGIVTNLKNAFWKWLLVPFFLIAQFWSTRRAIKELDPDVVHAHWLIPQGLAMALLAKFSGHTPPFLVTSHGADLYALRFCPLLAMKRFVARRAAAVSVVSSAMLQTMEEQGIPTEDVEIQPMGVDLQGRFAPDRSVTRSPDEVLFVGRLVEKKGLRYLLEAMPAVLEPYPDARLTIAGFGPEERALRRQAKALGISARVSFLGAVPQDELPALYRRAALFVAPFVEAESGDQEGLGLVTVEAIGCGCPILVSDLPAVSDVIAEASFKVRPADPEALSEAVNRVLGMPRENLMAQVEEIRQRLIGKFSWQARAQNYRDLLRSQFEGSSSPD